MAHEVDQRGVPPGGVDVDIGEGLGHRHAPTGPALFDQPGEDGRRHRLGVGSEVPAVVDGDRVGFACLAEAADPGPCHAFAADHGDAQGHRRGRPEHLVQGCLGRVCLAGQDAARGGGRRRQGESGQQASTVEGHGWRSPMLRPILGDSGAPAHVNSTTGARRLRVRTATGLKQGCNPGARGQKPSSARSASAVRPPARSCARVAEPSRLANRRPSAPVSRRWWR